MAANLKLSEKLRNNPNFSFFAPWSYVYDQVLNALFHKNADLRKS